MPTNSVVYSVLGNKTKNSSVIFRRIYRSGIGKNKGERRVRKTALHIFTI